GAQILSKAALTQLTALKLNGNMIGAEGALKLSENGWNELRPLNLFCKGIGAEGAALSKAEWTHVAPEICNQHNQEIIMFCNQDKQLLCQMCLEYDHQGHKALDFAQAVDSLRSCID